MLKEVLRRTILVAKKAGIEVKADKIGRKAEEKMNGARVPLLDKVQNLVGSDIVRRIVNDGWTPEELHKMTDGTQFDGVGAFADWACASTGFIMLDYNYEHCSYEEGQTDPTFLWTKQNVEILAAQWAKVQEIRGKIDKIVAWLEADYINRFRSLVDFL